VAPGTRNVTVGGAIAADVHGKNHHGAGSFGRHVSWLDVMTATGEVVRCSRHQNPDLFWATCGGHGLTGVVLRASVTLRPIASAFIRQETLRAANLDACVRLFDECAGSTYSVAWIDCLARGQERGRSVLMLGEHAGTDELGTRVSARPLSLPPRRAVDVPVDLPSFVLHPWSVRAFNAVYYRRSPRRRQRRIVPYDRFFYPLDAIGSWNRMYGKKGFVQYQFVVPKTAAAGLREVLRRVSDAGEGSFLAVLKLLGPQPSAEGNMSFPMEGYTLAMDFPVTPAVFRLLDELDAVVADHGGRVYLAKDARMARPVFDRMYGAAADRFRAVKSRWDPAGRFASLQSQRLGLG
jgi:FAD/FMN-containing dehydrogenase